MINYNKNKLINACLIKYYETFSHTLDTADFVPDKFNDKILNYIFKNMKKSFKKIDKEDRRYQKQKIKEQQAKAKKEKRRLKLVKRQAERERKLAKKQNRKSKNGNNATLSLGVFVWLEKRI